MTLAFTFLSMIHLLKNIDIIIIIIITNILIVISIFINIITTPSVSITFPVRLV